MPDGVVLLEVVRDNGDHVSEGVVLEPADAEAFRETRRSFVVGGVYDSVQRCCGIGHIKRMSSDSGSAGMYTSAARNIGMEESSATMLSAGLGTVALLADCHGRFRNPSLKVGSVLSVGNTRSPAAAKAALRSMMFLWFLLVVLGTGLCLKR